MYIIPHDSTIGIQGGAGSFNEQVIINYLTQINHQDCQINYCYTTQGVFDALENRQAQYGIFAIHNRAGGIVDESLEAIAAHRFEILHKIYLDIEHVMMIRSDSDVSTISQLMGHPQVFLQCRDTLAARYPHLPQILGEGNYIDTAYCAQALAEGMIDPHTAIVGPKHLANLYDLTIIDRGLQDFSENITTFLLIELVK